MEFKEGSLLKIFHRVQDMMYASEVMSLRIQYMTCACNCGEITLRDRVYQVHLTVQADKDAWIEDKEPGHEFDPAILDCIIDLIIVSLDVEPSQITLNIPCGFRFINGHICQVVVTFERERKKWFKEN